MSRAKGRAASGFRPKLHSRAESSSLESLDMSRAVGRESLNIPKFGRESLDMGRENLDNIPKFGHESLDMGRESLSKLSWPISRLSRPNFGMCRLLRPMFRLARPSFGMSRLSRPTARFMSILSRLKLSARLCNLGLNPDEARPLKSGHESGTSTQVLMAV